MGNERVVFIYGRSGSGKTQETVKRVLWELSAGQSVTLIVPEQQAVQTERLIAAAAQRQQPVIPTLGLDVVNFSRLANLIFREYGGLEYDYLDRGGRQLLMWRAVSDCAPELREYLRGEATAFKKGELSSSDRDLIAALLSKSDEFKNCRIEPERLIEAQNRLDPEKDARLIRKLSDLRLITERYSALLGGRADPPDDMAALCGILEEHDYFKDRAVYFDSFVSFSPAQYEVIRHIIAQAKRCVFTFPLLPEDSGGMYRLPAETAVKIRKIADEYGVGVTGTELRRRPRFERCGDIPLFADALFDYGKAAPTAEKKSFEVFSAGDIYEEAEFVARDIRRRVRLSYENSTPVGTECRQASHAGAERRLAETAGGANPADGLRWRDFAVVTRDIGGYDGVIDAFLDMYGIPFFISAPVRIDSKPLIRTVLSAIAVIAGNWRLVDVISYLKSGGFTGLSPDETRAVESYAETWSINGRAWHRADWNMNPRGFIKPDENDLAELERLNLLRQRFTEPLLRLGKVFETPATVADISRSLYGFIEELGLPEKAEAAEAAAPEEGILTLWGALMSALDRLVEIAGDLKADAIQYLSLLTLVIESSPVGRLPMLRDCVNISRADMMRLDDVKYVYIIGANEGGFPAASPEDRLLDSYDRKLLLKAGLELPPSGADRGGDELRYFYNAFTAASQGVFVSFPKQSLDDKKLFPSEPVKRLLKLSGSEPVDISLIPPHELAEEKDSSFRLINQMKDTAAGEALLKLYSGDAEGQRRLSAMETPLDADADRLSEAAIDTVYHKKSIYLTQTKLRKFASCPFSYTCDDLLRLTENRRAKFENSDIGSLAHTVLESFIKSRLKEDGTVDTDVTDEEIAREVDEIIDALAEEFINGGTISKRMAAMLRRVKKRVCLILRQLMDEFSQSDFRPILFEFPIGLSGSPSMASFEIPLDGGWSAYLKGRVDRVDSYRSENGKTWFRVCDYKTGYEKFRIDELETGLSLQMPLYLIAIWRGSPDYIRRALGSSDGELYPAGVLYFLAQPKKPVLRGPSDAEEIKEAALSAFTTEGMLLSDRELLEAMDKELKGRFVFAKLTSRGNLSKNKNIISEEEFKLKCDDVITYTKDFARRMRGGETAISPRMIDNQRYFCEFCPNSPVCRRINDPARQSDEGFEED